MNKKLLLLSIIFTLFSFLSAFLPAQEKFFQNEPEKIFSILNENYDSITISLYNNEVVQIKKSPQKVICCYTSFVTLWTLAGGKLIAIPNTNHPYLQKKSYSDLDTIGMVTSPNIEKILSLSPELVILSKQMEKHRAVYEILKKTGITALLLDYKNYNDFPKLLELFSKINGKELTENETAKKTLDEIQDIINKVPQNKKISFLSLFVSAGKSPNAETSNANTALIAKLLGGKNIIDKLDYPQKSVNINISIEKILSEEPDIILITTMGDEKEIQSKMMETFKNDPVWNSLNAIKNEKIYFLPNELFLYKANENYPESFKYIYKIFYGEDNM